MFFNTLISGAEPISFFPYRLYEYKPTMKKKTNGIHKLENAVWLTGNWICPAKGEEEKHHE